MVVKSDFKILYVHSVLLAPNGRISSYPSWLSSQRLGNRRAPPLTGKEIEDGLKNRNSDVLCPGGENQGIKE